MSVYGHRYPLALCISVSVYGLRYLQVDETSVLLVAPDASGSLAQGVVTQVCVCAPVWVCVRALVCVWVLNHTHTKTRAVRVFRGFDPYLVHA